jgi:CHAD domain-containing protein
MMRPKISKDAPITTKQSVEEAFQTIMQVNFDHMHAWEPVAYEGKSTNGVRKVRVSLRRMRSALPIFRAAFPRTVTDPWAKELKWAATQLGAARDLDVLIHERLTEQKDDAGKKKLAAFAQQNRDEAYAQVRAMLDSKRYASFKRTFAKWVKNKAWRDDLSGKNRRLLKKNIVPFAVKALNKCERRVLKAGSNIKSRSDEELHRLRIQCKKLRYAAEFFTPLFDRARMRNYINRLKELQDMLGMMHDIAVIKEGMLGPLLASVKDKEAHRFADKFMAEQKGQYSDVQKNFFRRWKGFVSTSAPWK